MYLRSAACLLLMSSVMFLSVQGRRTRVSTHITGLGESIEVESKVAPESMIPTALSVAEPLDFQTISADAQFSAKVPEATHAMSPSSLTTTKAAVPLHNHALSPPIVKHIVGDHYGSETITEWHMLSISSLLAGVTFAAFVKALSIASSIMVQISPFPQVLRWKSHGSTEQADAAPFVSIAFGGFQWCYYGLFAWLVTANSGFLVLVQANILGAVLGTYYLFEFYRNCCSEVSLSNLRQYLTAVSILILVQVCAVTSLPVERALLLTGLFSSLCSFLSASAVLVTVPEVVRSKDSRSIPGIFALANLCSATIWSICGWLLHDPMVMMPALFSMCCNTVALYCKIRYITTDTCTKDGSEHLWFEEDGGARMGRMMMAIKMELPGDIAPIKASSL